MTLIILLLGASAALSIWYGFWRAEGKKLQKSGYLPPETSYFARLFHTCLCRLLAFLTVGPVKVIGREKMPEGCRVLLVANHQFPCDFALLRMGTGRHYRALGDAAQFRGLLGLISAWTGVFTVTFKSKEERAAGEASAVKLLSTDPKGFRLTAKVASALAILLAATFIYSLLSGYTFVAVAATLVACLLGACKGGSPTLAIAPQGALMPDGELKKEEFRAGALRVAQKAAASSGERVMIVPIAIHYKRESVSAHWSQRFLKRTRSIYLGLRNPKHWDPLFKVDTDLLAGDEKEAIEAARAQKWQAYLHSHVTLFGGVVRVGDAINVADLPADPISATEEIRQKLLLLLAEAKRH